MATTIRLKRVGRTHAPYYRIVVMDSRDRSRGREIDELGIYHPCARPKPKTEIDRTKALSWLSKGATTSRTAKNLLSKEGILAEFVGVKVEAAPEAQAEAPVAEAAPEAPVEAPDAEAVPEAPVEEPAAEAGPEATAETKTPAAE